MKATLKKLHAKKTTLPKSILLPHSTHGSAQSIIEFRVLYKKTKWLPKINQNLFSPHPPFFSPFIIKLDGCKPTPSHLPSLLNLQTPIWGNIWPTHRHLSVTLQSSSNLFNPFPRRSTAHRQSIHLHYSNNMRRKFFWEYHKLAN